MRASVLRAVDGRVAGYVLCLVMMVLLSAAATKHLVKETKLCGYRARQCEKQKGEQAHRVQT